MVILEDTFQRNEHSVGQRKASVQAFFGKSVILEDFMHNIESQNNPVVHKERH